MKTIRKQRGWAGLVVILIVLAVVAMLSKDALKAYFSSATAPAEAAPDAAQATPSMATPIERARGVEATVQRQTEDMRGRLDAQAR